MSLGWPGELEVAWRAPPPRIEEGGGAHNKTAGRTQNSESPGPCPPSPSFLHGHFQLNGGLGLGVLPAFAKGRGSYATWTILPPKGGVVQLNARFQSRQNLKDILGSVFFSFWIVRFSVDFWPDLVFPCLEPLQPLPPPFPDDICMDFVPRLTRAFDCIS